MMTVKEMRDLLFAIDNQDMTIRELRAVLFQVADEESLVTSEDLEPVQWHESTHDTDFAEQMVGY